MEERIYNNVGNVLQLNKAGELIQKRMKAVKVCDGLYVTEPDKSGYMQFICELNGVVWLDCKAAENRIADGIKLMPGYFDKIKAGCFDGENIQEFKREISRRINHPDSPAIMELKQPERKKSVPLAENERKVSVYMFKGCYDEKTDKKVVITEVAPHVYTYAYKLKKYGERVKIILEVDGVYFEACDKGSYITEREDFTEVCRNAGEHARKNVADCAASGMAYFIEVQKRIDAAAPTETSRTSTEAAETVNVSAEGEKGADTREMPRYKCPNYADYAFERGWSIENTDFDPHSGVLCMIHFDPSDEKYVCGCLWQINSDKPNYTEHRRFKTLKGAQNYGTKRMGMKLKYQTLTVNCSVTPSEPSQSPEIPQETAEPANVSAEEGNEAIKHISEIMETCRTWDNEKRDYTDEYKYYTWLANHIPEHENTNKNVTEIVLEEVRERIATAATLVAHGVPKCDMEGAVCAVVNRLAKMEDILRFYDAIEPPQSPTTSTDIQTIKPQGKRAQTARKEPKRTIQISLIVQRPQSVVRNLRTSLSYHFADVRKMVVPRLVKNVPRGCFTGWSPPIRGDCVIV